MNYINESQFTFIQVVYSEEPNSSLSICSQFNSLQVGVSVTQIIVYACILTYVAVKLSYKHSLQFCAATFPIPILQFCYFYRILVRSVSAWFYFCSLTLSLFRIFTYRTTFIDCIRLAKYFLLLSFMLFLNNCFTSHSVTLPPPCYSNNERSVILLEFNDKNSSLNRNSYWNLTTKIFSRLSQSGQVLRIHDSYFRILPNVPFQYLLITLENNFLFCFLFIS